MPARFLLDLLSDALLPYLLRSLEDVVYEVLERREVPNRSEFRELLERVRKLEARLRELEAELARRPPPPQRRP